MEQNVSMIPHFAALLFQRERQIRTRQSKRLSIAKDARYCSRSLSPASLNAIPLARVMTM